MKIDEKVVFKNGVYYYKNGWKQTIGNITKVYVKGGDYERGIQFGKLLSREIKQVFKYFLFSKIKRKSEVPPLLRWLARWLPFLRKAMMFLLYRKTIRRQMEKYPGWVVEELRGMARGAGINPFYLELMNFIGGSEKVLGDKDIRALRTTSCCSFAYCGSDRNLYHAKNLDWVSMGALIPLYCFQQREDEKGDWFSIIGVPGGMAAYEFGMNSHGLSMALTGRFYRGKRASKMVLTDAIELEILRFGKNLEGVQEIYNTRTGFDRTDGLLISSEKDMDCKLFEVTPIGAAVTPSHDGVHFNTNFYVHPHLHKYNKQWGNIFNNEFCDPRYKRLKELLSTKRETLEDAFQILGDTTQPGFEHKSFLGQATINRFITNVSVVMVRGQNPGIWIATDYTYSAHNEFIYFDFSPRPREDVKKRAAKPIIYTEGFKNFKDFIKTRESRYDVSAGILMKKGEKLLEKEPGNPIFILFLAQNYLKYGQPTKALAVLKNHPVEWAADYWYCLGRANLQIKDYNRAREDFLNAMPLPCIDGFSQLVNLVCLVQLIKINKKLELNEEVRRLKQELKEIQSRFPTPNIGMPDYPYINNISEQMEEVIL